MAWWFGGGDLLPNCFGYLRLISDTKTTKPEESHSTNLERIHQEHVSAKGCMESTTSIYELKHNYIPKVTSKGNQSHRGEGHCSTSLLLACLFLFQERRTSQLTKLFQEADEKRKVRDLLLNLMPHNNRVHSASLLPVEVFHVVPAPLLYLIVGNKFKGLKNLELWHNNVHSVLTVEIEIVDSAIIDLVAECNLLACSPYVGQPRRLKFHCVLRRGIPNNRIL